MDADMGPCRCLCARHPECSMAPAVALVEIRPEVVRMCGGCAEYWRRRGFYVLHSDELEAGASQAEVRDD